MDGEKKKDFIRFEQVSKVYKAGEVEIPALRSADFTISEGEFAVIVGASGAGKTTLLNILGGMDTLTSGRVFVDEREISSLDSKSLTVYRRYDVGFVFQFYNLVPNLTALMKELQKRGVWIFGAEMNGNTSLYEADLKGPAAIVIGSEGSGMSRLVAETCDFTVSIPMKGKINSLNASAAAAILLYEAVRQRLS